MLKRLVFILLISSLGFSCTEYGRITRKGTVEEKYSAAVKYFDEREFYKCTSLLESILPYISGGDEFQDAMFIFAEAYFYQSDYIMSEYYYKKFMSKFPRHEKVPKAEYMVAKSLYMQSPKVNLDQTQTIAALSSLQGYINKYPKSEQAPECNNLIQELQQKLEDKSYRTAKLHYQIQNYKAAVTSMDIFAIDFPSSPYNEEMAFLRIESQVKLAKLSQTKIKEDGKIVYLQKERYQKALEFYYFFIDAYPESKYKGPAESLKITIENNLK